MASFEKAQSLVSINEGGYQNNPADAGNYYNGVLIGTNYGISAPVLASYLGRTPTTEEMRNLSKQTALSILKKNYWDKNNLSFLKNQSIANILFDGVVNHGTNGMRFLLERALSTLKIKSDYYEVFTKKGVETLNKLNQSKLFDAIKKTRYNKYLSSPKKQFIKGWLNRLEKFRFYAENTFSSLWNYGLVAIGIIGLWLAIIAVAL